MNININLESLEFIQYDMQEKSLIKLVNDLKSK